MDINFDSTGGTGSVTYGLRCNGTVTFSTSATWIKNMRYGNGELTFTVDGNTVSSERTGTITPSVNNTPCPGKTITVKQGGGSGPEPCDTHIETSVTKTWDVTKDVRIVSDKESVGCNGGEITASLIGGVEHWQEVTSEIINCSGTVISTTTSSAKTGENTETIESSTYMFNPIEDDGEDHDIPYTFSFDYDSNNYQHTVHQICNWACPSTTVTSGDSGVTYFNIRNINIGEINGADSIGCSGGTVTVSGATIGVGDYDKYYILSSITYDCNDTITGITTSRKNLGDEYKETINLPASSYTIDGIDCDTDSGIREKEFTYEYIYYDENNAESSVTSSFTVNQNCECEDCDEYIYSIGHNSTLNFDDCGNHLEFNHDYSLDGHPITSITTNGTSVKASVYSAMYSCVTKDDKWISYTPKVVWELDGGESRYAILNGDTSITSVTSSATMVSVNAEYNGEKYQDINVYVYGYGKDSERIVYSGNCEPHRDKFCIPGECHKCELNVDFNGLNGSTIHRGERFTVSGTSMICSFVKSGNNGDVDSKLIWDPVILSISPSGYVEISNDAHDDNTSGFSFDVSLSNTCQSSMNGLVLTVSQSGETDCHESVTFNVECGSSTACPQWHIVPDKYSLPSSGGVVTFQAYDDQMDIYTENGTFTLTPTTGYTPNTANNSIINFNANTSFDPITYKVNYEDESGCTAEGIDFVVAGKPHEYKITVRYYHDETGHEVSDEYVCTTGFEVKDFIVDGTPISNYSFEMYGTKTERKNTDTDNDCKDEPSTSETWRSNATEQYYYSTTRCHGYYFDIDTLKVNYNGKTIYFDMCDNVECFYKRGIDQQTGKRILTIQDVEKEFTVFS